MCVRAVDGRPSRVTGGHERVAGITVAGRAVCNGILVSGINLYDPGGELQTDLDQGVGCGLLQEVQPALDLLDPQLQVDCDVRQASRQGLISAPPTFTTVNKYISNPDLTPLITDLI